MNFIPLMIVGYFRRVNRRSCRWYNIHNERRSTNTQSQKRKQRGGAWVLNSMTM